MTEERGTAPASVEKEKKKQQAKPNRRQVATPSPEQRDAFHRMSYLYQASQLMTMLGVNGREGPPASLTLQQEPHVPQAHAQTLPVGDRLSRHYASQLQKIARKMVMRVDPHVKRTLCKGCDGLLVPGLTASVCFEDGLPEVVSPEPGVIGENAKSKSMSKRKRRRGRGRGLAHQEAANTCQAIQAVSMACGTCGRRRRLFVSTQDPARNVLFADAASVM
jgi:RNase P subunit RPR2